ncbi:MAG: hypothetical protein AAFX06_01485 [Planctomycetota bacterium]
MTGEYNPYQAPLESAIEGEVARPRPSQLISERYEFEGELTRRHYRDAMRRTKFRGDVWSSHRTLTVICTLAVLGCLWWVFANANSTGEQVRVLAFMCTLILAAGAVMLRNRWIIGSLIPDNQLLIGSIRGWLDGETLCLHSKSRGITSYSEMNSLYSTAYNNELMVLNFGSESVMWTTLPFDFFPDPMAAQTIAEDLYQLYPPKTPVAPDERRREQPTDAFRFERGPNAIGFDGPLRHEVTKGSYFDRRSRRIVRGTLSILSISGLAVALSICSLFGFDLLIGLWILGTFVMLVVFARLKRWLSARRTKEDTGNVMWNSRGWFDEMGYHSMTTAGQSQLLWQAFDHHEITDQMIVLYPNASDFCGCLIGREQFATEADWQGACQLVRDHTPAHPGVADGAGSIKDPPSPAQSGKSSSAAASA